MSEHLTTGAGDLPGRDAAMAASTAAADDDASAAAGERRSTLIGTAAALTALFGVGSSLAVLEVVDDYPAAGGQALRYALAAVLLALVLRRRGAPRPSARQLGRLALLAASGLAGFNLLVIAAERSMDPASVGVVVATVPIVLAIAAPLQERRRIRPRVLLAAAIVALGAAAVQGVGGDVTIAGLAAAIGALLGEAAFSLVAAPLLPSLGALGVSAWCTALAVPQLLAYGIVVDGPSGMLRAPALDEALVFVYLGAVVTAGCFVLWYTGVRLLGVERAGLLTGAMPAGALLTGALIGASTLSVGRLAGVLAVAAGIAVGMRAAGGGDSGRAGARGAANCGIEGTGRVAAAGRGATRPPMRWSKRPKSTRGALSPPRIQPRRDASHAARSDAGRADLAMRYPRLPSGRRPAPCPSSMPAVH